MKPTKQKTAAPTHLSAASKAWFLSVQSEYHLEPHHLKLLQGAAESWDRAQQARKLLKTEGITTRDRFQQIKSHPAVAVERDSLLRYARLLRELGLDESEPSEIRIPRVGGKS